MGACETTPTSHSYPEASPTIPEPRQQPITSKVLPLPIIGRRSPASSSFVVARPPGARLRALQLDSGPRDGTKTGTYEESHKHGPTQPSGTKSPGQISTPSRQAGPPWVRNEVRAARKRCGVAACTVADQPE
jgi:hypothetical protein